MSDHPTTPDLPAPAPTGVRVNNPARPRPPRLPGTDAASFARDMNWRHGVAALWIFFVLTVLGEAVLAAFILLQGDSYPAPYDALRLCLEGMLFLALWLGWGPLRWALAALNFFYGAWLIVWLISIHAEAASAAALAGSEAPGYGIALIPQIGLGLLYVTYAAYLVFSADVLDFLRHRREEGRLWVFVPVALWVGVCLVSLLNAQRLYLRWMDGQRASAIEFVTSSLKTMSGDHWNVAAYESRADPEYLKTWFDGDRKNVFDKLSKLGGFWSTDHRLAVLGSALDATGSGFVLRGRVDLGLAEFAHGRTPWNCEVTRPLFGPWKMQGFDAGTPRFDAAPSRAHP